MRYLEFLRLMSEARLVLTDSGGIQDETTILQIPCMASRRIVDVLAEHTRA
jgi:UDP-N-acetylglucosamine 2-epimerase (non-hydrolysing)